MNSDLKEDIYLRPPDGVPVTLGKVWKLKKALYGLKQAVLEWYHTLQADIKLIGYHQSGYDLCLYVWDAEDFITVYVDDLLLFVSSQKLARSKKELTSKFKMCDLGEVRWFLTMEITHDWTAHMITVDQR